MIKILGIDPGSRVVGFACLAARKEIPAMPADFCVVDVGVLKVKDSIPPLERIGMLHNALFELASSLAPTVCAMEKAFYGVNAATSLKLGEARGALIAAIRRCNVDIVEVTPAQIKRMIAGSGRAEKEDIAAALKALLKFDRGKLPYDATDALAVALCHGLSIAFQKKIK